MMSRRKNRTTAVNKPDVVKSSDNPVAVTGRKRRLKKSGTKSDSRDDVTVRRPPKFSWVVDGLLAAQGRPTLPGHLQYLCDNNVKYIVTLTKTKPRALLDLPDSLEWVHIPIQDETAPTVAQIQQLVSLVDKAESKDVCVSVHCAWGRGRTGTMMACYLAHRRHLSADAAIAEIRRMRPGSVDSAKQETAVHLYVQSLAKK